MAELIERGKLLKALATSREYHAASCREQNLLIRAEIIVREQPTTTEAEIRNKAIDEFLKKLLEHCDHMTKENWNKHVHPTSWAVAYEEFKTDIEEIALELRGE